MGKLEAAELDARKKILRQGIMAACSKLNWDYETSHLYFKQWGFGSSLRKMSLGELVQLNEIVNGLMEPEEARFSLGVLDEQGRYAWSLMKQAGWNWLRLRQLILKRCKATHWNALSEYERRGIINILKAYVAKKGATGKAPGEKFRCGAAPHTPEPSPELSETGQIKQTPKKEGEKP